MDPGSAAQRCTPRCARGTWDKSQFLNGASAARSVPGLTLCRGIKLNARLLLRRHWKSIACPYPAIYQVMA
jgi:hypothetical protein